MSEVNVNRETYLKLIQEDIAVIESLPKTLERDHVIEVLKESVDLKYPKRPKSDEKITAVNLDIGLRILGIHISGNILDQIVKIVNVLQIKGGKMTISDVIEIKSK